MAEKGSKPPPIVGLKPVPMKLFATWEVDRTPPNCIPRYSDSFNKSFCIVASFSEPEFPALECH
jgi:hypothetical protein